MSQNHNIINIGRQYGSGGKEVAEMIGLALGIEVYDSELISKAAEESGFSKELFKRSDEKRSFFNLFSFFGAERFGSSQNYVGDNELFRIQSEVIRGIARHFCGTLLKLYSQGQEMPRRVHLRSRSGQDQEDNGKDWACGG